jgi:hypothetical protein
MASNRRFWSMNRALEFLLIIAIAIGVGVAVKGMWPKRQSDPIAIGNRDSKPWLKDPIVGHSDAARDCKEPTAPWKCDPIVQPKKSN